MPTLINGCGTWYCGKRRIHRVKAGCAACGGFVELESYDTTLYFVIFMVPVVPLGQKRILESCPSCHRHKIVKLKDWEAGKAKAFNAILEKLQANPDDRETIQMALGLATVYQDEKLFDKLADALAGHRTDDAEIQAQLGSAYEYFSRWSDAEDAYTRSLKVEPTDDTRERLAVCLLKQNRPEEAADHVRHVFESKDPEKAWLVFWLVEGFMARGMHEQALAVMDVRDELFPKLACTKDYQKQRKTAEKNRASGKPIRSAYLAESARTGFREGSGLAFKWPRYVAAAVFIGLLALYLGVAIYRGQHRPVYLVNGWSKAYTVKVNGDSHQLAPGTARKIEVPEGEVEVDWPEGGDGPQKVQVETSFFGRPFHRPVFVINPDRLAILEWDEMVYASVPVNADHPPEFRTGELLHEFKGVDYEFEPFPPEIQAKAGSQITKTRVGLLPVSGTHDRIFKAMLAGSFKLSPEYIKRVLHLDPADSAALEFLAGWMPPAEALGFLRSRLADRPVLVEWHRTYQDLMGRVEPATDLRPDYRKLVEETKRAPDSVYLLARLEDGVAADKLLEEAARGTRPAVRACAELSFNSLSRGDFDGAVDWASKARTLNPRDPMIRRAHVDALLAAGRWAELLTATQEGGPPEELIYLRARLTAHIASGEAGAAEGEIQRTMNRNAHGAPSPELRFGFDVMLAEVKRDRAKFLELWGHQELPLQNLFASRLLRGDYRGAAAQETSEGPTHPGDWDDTVSRAGLVYLAASKATDAAFAGEQWKRLVQVLKASDRKGLYFAAVAEGTEPFDVARVKALPVKPFAKRVILTALARKFPEHAKELDLLAKKLDFERDEVSLCLRYVTE